MSEIPTLMENNRRWAEGITERDPEFFERLSQGQSPQVLWIGCADSRVPANQVIGASDKMASDPVTRAYYPADMGATIYSALGIDPSSQVVDRLRRPHQLNKGEVIAPLYGAA